MNKVLFNKEAFDILKKGVDILCDAVKVTLGPNGKNVLIFNNYGDAHLTKDGITVANNVKYDDPIINGIINVVKEASANNAKSVGDGTTTTTICMDMVTEITTTIITTMNHITTLISQSKCMVHQSVGVNV